MNHPPADDAGPIALLDLLLACGYPLTLNELSRRLGCEIEMVRRQLDQLRQADCRFEEHPQAGVCLMETGLGTWVDYLHWSDPRTDPTPRLIELYRTTASTQDVARRMIELHGVDADGGLVIADEQTAGRGRLHRRWYAPPGTSLTFSRACLPDTLNVDYVTLSVAVAVANAIEAVTSPPLSLGIKWPNDVLLDGRKLAGILVETFTDRSGRSAAVVGVGVNVSLDPNDLPDDPPDLRKTATSLAAVQRGVDRLPLLAELVKELDLALSQQEAGPLVEEWRRRSVLLGQRVHLRSEGQDVSGQVMDIDPYDGLIVRTDEGPILHLPAATTTIVG